MTRPGAPDDDFRLDDTTVHSAPALHAHRQHPVLSVLEGDDVHRFHELRPGNTILGRDPTCEIPLADATASRRHACVRLAMTDDGPVVEVEDLGSTNGTLINGERVSGVVLLREHDRIRIGGITFAYSQRDEREIEHERRLVRLATYDSLTNLLNRTAFLRELAREVERARRYNRSLALLMVDVDHFKRINDTWGHPTGDRVLAQIGRVLRSVLRTCDHAGRYGGEECGIALVETSYEGALIVAERTRVAVASQPFGLPNTTITISIGGAVWQEGNTAEGLLARADTALYAAKNSGRNRVVFAE